MTDEMEHHEKFDAFLAREAESYHRPPAETPREEMWAAIAQARSASRAAAAESHGGRSARRDTGRRPLRLTPWVGIAAALVVGVGIGRYALNLGDADREPRTPQVVGGSGGPPEPESQPQPIASAPAASEPGRPAPVRRAIRGTTPPSVPDRSNGTSLSAGYRVASEEHLQRAEALVAVVAATPADAIMDSLMGRWARDVLSNTRLLLDSPAGVDPVRRRLLEDLETLLVQLVQRSGTATEERAMIDRTLQRTQLLTRLRSGAAGT